MKSDRDGDSYDCGLHNETLILKAKDLGLDTLVIGNPRQRKNP